MLNNLWLISLMRIKKPLTTALFHLDFTNFLKWVIKPESNHEQNSVGRLNEQEQRLEIFEKYGIRVS